MPVVAQMCPLMHTEFAPLKPKGDQVRQHGPTRPTSRGLERRPGMVHGSRVTTERPDRARLARLVRSRRLELKFDDQIDLARATGLTKNTVGAVEQRKKVSEKTTAAIELALRWAPGSIDTILDGGDPVPLDSTDLSLDDSAGSARAGGAAEVIDVRKASPEELAAVFRDMAHDYSDAEILEVMSQVMKLRAQDSAARDAG